MEAKVIHISVTPPPPQQQHHFHNKHTALDESDTEAVCSGSITVLLFPLSNVPLDDMSCLLLSSIFSSPTLSLSLSFCMSASASSILLTAACQSSCATRLRLLAFGILLILIIASSWHCLKGPAPYPIREMRLALRLSMLTVIPSHTASATTPRLVCVLPHLLQSSILCDRRSRPIFLRVKQARVKLLCCGALCLLRPLYIQFPLSTSYLSLCISQRGKPIHSLSSRSFILFASLDAEAESSPILLFARCTLFQPNPLPINKKIRHLTQPQP